ncbi:MBL fold metallo-hydrolase [Paenibacillus apiarius]|uniref:MBL fold metallo-hydrolase n=1 Tax=Paenibacillus apiarius TaxID=46240 RepID=UPI003B3AA312
MIIANGIATLEISAFIMGKKDTIYPTLLWDKDTAILVDACYPGQLPHIREAMEQTNVPLDKLDTVILTHQDLDHIGSLPLMLKESPRKIEVLASEVERPYIQGDKRLLKLTAEAVEQADAMLPPDLPEQLRSAFKAMLANPPQAQVDRTLADGDVLPYCGGIIVIDTPGHTPGHISLYHQPSKSLIAGDAMVIADGELHGPNPQYSLDIDTAISSLNKLAQFEIDTVICYHGGVFQGNVNERIARLAAV